MWEGCSCRGQAAKSVNESPVAPTKSGPQGFARADHHPVSTQCLITPVIPTRHNPSVDINDENSPSSHPQQDVFLRYFAAGRYIDALIESSSHVIFRSPYEIWIEIKSGGER
jgi:hypothetical protein